MDALSSTAEKMALFFLYSLLRWQDPQSMTLRRCLYEVPEADFTKARSSQVSLTNILNFLIRFWGKYNLL